MPRRVRQRRSQKKVKRVLFRPISTRGEFEIWGSSRGRVCVTLRRTVGNSYQTVRPLFPYLTLVQGFLTANPLHLSISFTDNCGQYKNNDKAVSGLLNH